MHLTTYPANQTTDEYYTDGSTAPLHCGESSTSNKNTPPVGRYFANVLASSTGRKFNSVKFQIDTAATCNTISESPVNKLFPDLKINSLSHLLFPYGNSKPIKPIGQIELLCEKNIDTLHYAFKSSPHVLWETSLHLCRVMTVNKWV